MLITSFTKKIFMSFTDQEYFEVMDKNENVKEAYEKIKQICLKKHETE